MSEPRARVKAVEGPYAVWDPADPGPFTARAGGRLVRTEDACAVIRTRDGDELTLPPGCLAIVGEDGEVTFCTPEQAEILPAA